MLPNHPVRTREVELFSCKAIRFWRYDSPTGPWEPFGNFGKEFFWVTLLQDKRTHNIRCLAYATNDENSNEITKVASNHFVHPMSVMPERDDLIVAFWVQDFAEEADLPAEQFRFNGRSPEPKEFCLQIKFENENDKQSFTNQYKKSQEDMRILHADTKLRWSKRREQEEVKGIEDNVAIAVKPRNTGTQSSNSAISIAADAKFQAPTSKVTNDKEDVSSKPKDSTSIGGAPKPTDSTVQAPIKASFAQAPTTGSFGSAFSQQPHRPAQAESSSLFSTLKKTDGNGQGATSAGIPSLFGASSMSTGKEATTFQSSSLLGSTQMFGTKATVDQPKDEAKITSKEFSGQTLGEKPLDGKVKTSVFNIGDQAKESRDSPSTTKAREKGTDKFEGFSLSGLGSALEQTSRKDSESGATPLNVAATTFARRDSSASSIPGENRPTFPNQAGEKSVFTFPASPQLTPKPFSPPIREVSSPVQMASTSTPPGALSPKTRLTRFLEKNHPSRLGEVNGLLTEYKGREGDLWEELRRQYPKAKFDSDRELPPFSLNGSSSAEQQVFAPTPTQNVSTRESASPPRSAELSPKTRLTQYYQKYNPAKIEDVPTLLEKYKGREEEMFAKLKKRYESGGDAGAAQSNNAKTPLAVNQMSGNGNLASGGGMQQSAPALSTASFRPSTIQASPATPAAPASSAAWGTGLGTISFGAPKVLESGTLSGKLGSTQPTSFGNFSQSGFGSSGFGASSGGFSGFANTPSASTGGFAGLSNSSTNAFAAAASSWKGGFGGNVFSSADSSGKNGFAASKNA